MSSDDITKQKKENQLIIGICGPSTSGKSTIIDELVTRYSDHSDQIEVIALETFFKTHKAPTTKIFGKKFTNLDLRESIKWDLFYNEIFECDSAVIFLDGFILFANEQSYDLVDVCVSIDYDVDKDFDVALDRRIHRYPWDKNKIIDKDYLKKPFKNPVNAHCTYFHEIVWPEMVKHPEYRKPLNWEKPHLALKATNDLNENVSLAFNFLNPFIDSYLNL